MSKLCFLSVIQKYNNIVWFIIITHVLWKFVVIWKYVIRRLSADVTLTTDTLGELHVLWHDGHTLGVDRATVGVLVKTNQISLGGFLEGENGLGLETKVVLVLLSDLANEALERRLADEEVSGLLVLADLTQSDRAGTEAVLLGASGSADNTGLLGERGARGLAGNDFASGLLSAGHREIGRLVVVVVSFFFPESCCFCVKAILELGCL